MGFIHMTLIDLIDIVVVAAILFQIYRLTRGTNALRIVVGILMPALLTMERVGIYETLLPGVYLEQEIYVLLAGLKLVALNTVRAYPHYMGVFFLIESFRFLFISRFSPPFNNILL